MDEKLGEIVHALDTATGMLIVAAMKDQTVRKAMGLVTKASFDLGNFIDEEEQGSAPSLIEQRIKNILQDLKDMDDCTFSIVLVIEMLESLLDEKEGE